MQEQLDRIERKLIELEGKLDSIFISSEKMRKYFLWTVIITVVAIVVPLVIFPFFLPTFFQSQGVNLPPGL